MIKIINNECFIEIKGHSGYDKKGADIVCAAISAIVFGTINSLKSIDKKEVKIQNNKILIFKKKMSPNDKIRMDMMLLQIQTVADVYPKNIQIRG